MSIETEQSAATVCAPQLHLRLTPAEINALVGYLGRSPYLEVAELIHKIAGQVQPQRIEQHQAAQAAALAATPALTEARN